MYVYKKKPYLVQSTERAQNRQDHSSLVLGLARTLHQISFLSDKKKTLTTSDLNLLFDRQLTFTHKSRNGATFFHLIMMCTKGTKASRIFSSTL